MIQAVSGGGGGFDPSQLSGLELWLDASDVSQVFTDAGVTSVSVAGDLIYQWADKSGNNRHATQTTSGNRPTWQPYAINQNGIVFNGSNQRLTMPVPALASGYSIYCLLKLPRTGGGYPTAVSLPNAGTNASTGIIYYNSGAKRIGLSQWGDSLENPLVNNIGDIIAVATKYNGAHPTGEFSVEVFGKSAAATKNMAQTTGTPQSGTGAIGSDTQPTPSQFGAFTAYEIIVYSGSKTAAEEQTLSNYLLTKWDKLLTNANTLSLLLNMQGSAGSTTFIDDSPNAFAVTPVGDAQLVSDATFGTVASFDGAGDYLRGIDALPLTADWTIEGWYYHTGGTGYRAIFSTRTQTDGGWNNSIWFGVTDTNKLYFDGSTSGALKIIGTTTVASGTWYHVCVVRRGSVVTLYVNGVSEGTVTDTNSKSTSGFWIGGQFDRYFLTGSLGPLRITKGVARYTANFTPPTGLFPTS